MKIVKKINITLCFSFFIIIFSCKSESQIKKDIQIKKAHYIENKDFIKKESCFIDEDNEKDTIILKALPQKDKFTFNFYILIKYKHKGIYKTKKINFKDSPNALFWGVNVDDNNSIRIGYSDDFFWENIYVINYNIKNDNFYIIKYIEVYPKDKMEFKYENLSGYEGKIEDRAGFVELDAVSIRRNILKPILIEDTLKLSYKGSEEIIKIPKDNSGRLSSEVDAILRINLEEINKH